ncbi:hypothetical protein EDB84DRAFT_1645356 [Lactarius hengduanensis]|nr:hypothetical protein EDB84DRAFT_1645356 [Lactarius hengduanensis]
MPPPSIKWERLRTVALRSFRDKIILPIATALNATQRGRPTREPHLSTPPANASHLSLTRPVTHRRLTALASAPSQGELATQHLLKVVQSDASGTCTAAQRRGPYTTGTHSSHSGNVLHDRHGRITHKPGPLSLDEPGSDFEDDALTPRPTMTITVPRQATMVASSGGDDDSGSS